MMAYRLHKKERIFFQGYTASPMGRLLEEEKLHTTQEGTAKFLKK